MNRLVGPPVVFPAKFIAKERRPGEDDPETGTGIARVIMRAKPAERSPV